jgi:hypothetical protein
LFTGTPGGTLVDSSSVETFNAQWTTRIYIIQAKVVFRHFRIALVPEAAARCLARNGPPSDKRASVTTNDDIQALQGFTLLRRLSPQLPGVETLKATYTLGIVIYRAVRCHFETAFIRRQSAPGDCDMKAHLGDP